MSPATAPPALHHPASDRRKEGLMHPLLAAHEVAYREAERRRDADGQRLAHLARHPAVRRTLPVRARLGTLLVRAGEALGAPPDVSQTSARTGHGREAAY